MSEFVNGVLDSVAYSPWLYLAILVAVAVDAFLPVVPGEAIVIGAGVLAAEGAASLPAAVAVAALGALAGDHVSYLIGRSVGNPGLRRLLRGRRGAAAHERVRRAFLARGGLVIVALRFVSGGRTATTLVAGTVRFPVQRFSAFAAIAAALWAVYVGLIGYWAGGLFGGDPLRGLAAGLGISLALTVLAEAARTLHRRRSPGGRAATAGADPHTDPRAASQDPSGGPAPR